MRVGRPTKGVCCQVGFKAWADTPSSCSTCRKLCHADSARHRWCTAQTLAGAWQTAAMTVTPARRAGSRAMSATCTLLATQQQGRPWVAEVTAQPAVAGSLCHLLVLCLQAGLLCQLPVPA